jgi:uncharacterized protein
MIRALASFSLRAFTMWGMVIRSLHVYPIKGGAGVDVESIHIDAHGFIENDRALMLVDADTGQFVSQRQVPALARLRTHVGPVWRLSFDADDVTLNPTDLGPARSVIVWDDTVAARELDIGVSRWIATRLERDVRLVVMASPDARLLDPFWTAGWTAGRPAPTSFADFAPALLTNTASLEDLNHRRSTEGLAAVPMSRFRPNIVVDHNEPFAEDGWSVLHAASVSLRCIKPSARCLVTQVDQSTGRPTGDGTLRSLAAFRTRRNRRGTQGIWFGQNVLFETAMRAELRVGDRLQLADEP